MANQYMTTEEIAQILNIHEETVRRYIRSGLLPAIRLKGVYRVRRADFEKFIEEREVKPEEDPEE